MYTVASNTLWAEYEMIIENESEFSTEMVENNACANSLVSKDKNDDTMKSHINFEVFSVCAVVVENNVYLLKSLTCLFPCLWTGWWRQKKLGLFPGVHSQGPWTSVEVIDISNWGYKLPCVKLFEVGLALAPCHKIICFFYWKKKKKTLFWGTEEEKKDFWVLIFRGP